MFNRGADRKATAQLGAQQWRLYRNQTNYLPATANAMGRLTASNHAFNITPDSSSLLQKEWDSPIPSEARELDFAHALQCSCHNKAGSVLFLVTGPAFNSQEKPSFISHGILTLQSWCEASGEEPYGNTGSQCQSVYSCSHFLLAGATCSQLHPGHTRWVEQSPVGVLPH